MTWILNMLKKRSAALTQLDRYLEALRGTCNSLLDEYQLPDAIYLKGLLHAQDFDMATARECCDYAHAVEAKRCPFFGIANCSAKRSLMRICKYALGNAQSHAKAYVEFMAAYSIVLCLLLNWERTTIGKRNLPSPIQREHLQIPTSKQCISLNSLVIRMRFGMLC